MSRPIVITGVCPDTGSWLADTPLSRNVLRDEVVARVREKGQFDVAEKNTLFRRIREIATDKCDRFVIRELSWIEAAVSYPLHTNRELRMMLDGLKDFSVFSRHQGEVHRLEGKQRFQKYKSRILKRSKKIGLATTTFYFLESSLWKIQAYECLCNCILHTGASAQTEFIQGMLLGYTVEQNVEYLKNHWEPFVAARAVKMGS